MLAYRVREHNTTDQTIKNIENKHNERSGHFKNRSTTNNVLSVFFVAAPKSRSVYIGSRQTIHLSGTHENIPHELDVYLSRNVDALLKVGAIIKVVVFRTLCCVVARIALATDCCCCWSIR